MSTFRPKTDEFIIELPEGWTERQNEGAWEFLDPSGKDQVIVTVLAAKKALSRDEVEAVLARTLDARQHALREVSRGLASLVPVRNQTSERSVATSLVGSDPMNAVLIYCRIIATPWRVVTASYNGCGASQDVGAFTARAEPVCESLRASEHPVRKRHWWQRA